MIRRTNLFRHLTRVQDDREVIATTNGMGVDWLLNIIFIFKIGTHEDYHARAAIIRFYCFKETCGEDLALTQ